MYGQIGAWVEGTVAKRDGKGVRKVWVSDARAAGEPSRLSVIAPGERGDVHVLTLRVNTPEARQQAREALELALATLRQYESELAAPAIKAPAVKAPTPPKAPKAPANTRPDAPAVVRNPAPAKAAELDWFASLMQAEGA